MKHSNLCFTLILHYSFNIYSQLETEPNDDASQSNYLNGKATIYGTMSEAERNDLSKNDVPYGGILKLYFTSDSGHLTTITLQDCSQLNSYLDQRSFYFNNKFIDIHQLKKTKIS